MYRYFFKTEDKEPGTHIHDVNDYKLPDNNELSDFLEKRKKDIIGHTSTLYHIRAGEIINIDSIDYKFLCSKKYYQKEDNSTRITLICEICLMQSAWNLEHLVAYNFKNEEDV